MHKYQGQCRRGNVEVLLQLPQTLDQYQPRQCDCDFCTARNILYLSDPNGELEIKSTEPLETQYQGSEQAAFLTCPSCKSIVAASIHIDDKLIGALNANLLLECSNLGPPKIVSPKSLNKNDKVERWKSIWLDIRVINGNATDKIDLK